MTAAGGVPADAQHDGLPVGEHEYVRQLEDAVNLLWGWMPVKESKEIRAEIPDLADFCGHIHHKVDHEEAMVRRPSWGAAR